MNHLEQLNFYVKGYTINIIHNKNPLDYYFETEDLFYKFQFLIIDIIEDFGFNCLLNQSIIFQDIEFEVINLMFYEGKKITIIIL